MMVSGRHCGTLSLRLELLLCSEPWASRDEGGTFFGQCIAASLLSLLIGLGWFALLFQDMRAIIVRASSVCALVEIATVMVALLVEGYLTAGILTGIFIAANIMFAVKAKEHAQFLGALLDMITRMLQAFPGTIAVAALASIVQTAFLIVWAITVRSVLEARQTYSGTVTSLIYLLFSLRWTLSVLHSIVSGVASASMRKWLQMLAQEAAMQDMTTDDMVPGQLDEEFGLGPEGGGAAGQAASSVPEQSGAAELKGAAPQATEANSGGEHASPDAAQAGDIEQGGAGGTAGAVRTGGVHGGGVGEEEDWNKMDTAATGGDTQDSEAASQPHGVAAGDAHMPLDANAEASSVQPLLFPLGVAAQGALPRVGAIILGSLLGLVTPLLWPAMRLGRVMKYSSRGCLSGIGGGVSLLAERGLARTHKYALVSVLWDKLPWMEAAQRVWRELLSRGTEAVVAEDKVDRVLLFCCCTGGATALLVTGAGIVIHGMAQVLCVFWLGFSGVALFLSLVDGADAGLIVAFTEAPELLSTAHWTVYHRFVRIAETHQVRNRPSAGQ